MANKFTQSILERQYKEAQEEKRARKPKAEGAPPAEAPPQSLVPETEILEAPPTAEPEPTKAADVKLNPITPRKIQLSAPMNLDDYIIKDTERVAKNKTFYLDQAVIEGIKSAAKRQKVTDSKLVNDILKKVLGV